MRLLAYLFLWIQAQVIVFADIDIGDYVDPTFHCPAKTTCPVVCVPTGILCPSSLTCPTGTFLCQDGTCEANCTTADAAFDPASSPCPSCTPVICPKIINYFDQCHADYDLYYNSTAECDAKETLKEYTLLETPFVIVFVFVTVITSALFLWCAINQRLLPVCGSIQPLLAVEGVEVESGWTQTGYMGGYSYNGFLKNPIGMTLYYSLLIMLLGLHGILAMLTVWYYGQQGAIPGIKYHFEDDVNLLQAFELTWIVAFPISFLVKWPPSILSLYFRRSLLKYANYVAVFTPVEADKSVATGKRVERISNFLSLLYHAFIWFMHFIFSDVNTREDGEITYCPVIEEHGSRFFVFRLRRYIFDEQTSKFEPGFVNIGTTVGDIISRKNGLTTSEALDLRKHIGPNTIDIKKPFFLRTIVQEFSKPFYTYQLFMVWAWFPFNYYFMATVQACIILSGGLSVAVFQYRNERNLYRLSRVSGNVSVLRDGAMFICSQDDLVPGDVVEIKAGIIFADMIVLSTDVVIVDESALTGESTPMAKSAIDLAESQTAFEPFSHKKYFLSAGTTCIEVSPESFALVLKTGSYTAKGMLLRDVLSFRRHKFKFDTQVNLVLLILVCYAIIGFVLTTYYYHDHFAYEFFYAMYVVETAIPPLLPTVFTVSVGISNDRLARKRIACSNSEGILVAGKVDMAFFDKTGTLTKQGLEFISASRMISGCAHSKDKMEGNLEVGMATCHTLTKSKAGKSNGKEAGMSETSSSSLAGVLIGNQVDIKMFLSTGAFLSQSDVIRVQMMSGRTYTVLKRFDFDHHRMTMSVIIRDEDGSLFAFAKGSGESIKKCCMPSTMPEGFDASLEQTAKEGIYQISIAMKELSNDVASSLTIITRDEIESNLLFVGVVNFKNVLREETPAVIRELWQGNVKPTMLTGDSVMTGISIARECGIIKSNESVILGKSVTASGVIEWYDDSDAKVSAPTVMSLRDSSAVLAVTGTVWESMANASFIESLALGEYIRVFGRSSPNNKADIVTAFVEKGHVCCMAGDGGNDCGALRTAHVGIALSDAEASTVSSFTSLDKSITSVVEVLKEGRCALASAFASYKYMIMYGQVETMNQLMNAYFQVTFSEWCWVFMDGVWMITMAFTLPLAQAAKELSPTRPTSDLLGWHTLSSTVGVLVLNFTFTVIALATLFSSSFFQCRRWNSSDISNVTTIGDNYEAEVLFLVTGYQYISSAMAFNFGYKYRANWFRNWIFVTLALAYTVIYFVVIIHPANMSCLWRVNCTNDHIVRGITSGPNPVPINNNFNTTVMPLYFRWILVGIIVGNTIAIMSWEYFIVNGIGHRVAEKHKKSIR